MTIVNIFCLVLAFFACVYDLRTFKIPNRLSFIGILAGTIYNLVVYGLHGIKISALGILYPIAILSAFFIMRFLGAGDIKLLSAIGAFTGARVLRIMFLTFMIAAVYSFIVVVYKLVNTIIIKKNKEKYKFSKLHLSIPVFLACMVRLIEEFTV